MSRKAKTSLLGPWRRTFQWTTTLLILLVPWLSIGGKSVLRIDLGSLSLQFFGQTLRIEELYLFLLFVLAFCLGFLLLTLVFGRLWCGWACPQTTLSDVAEWLTRRLGLKPHHNKTQGLLWRKLLLHLSYLGLALLIGANLLWYFIEPKHFFGLLSTVRLPLVPSATLAAVALCVYLDLALVRRLMCSEFCPYGRFQAALVDKSTLTLHLPETEASRCIDCGACVRSCPMGIDIRRGYQVECINCGRCLDACRQVMAKRRQPGLIRYSFGLDDSGLRSLVNPRTILLATTTTLLLLALAVGVVKRPDATLKVAVSHTAASRILGDGRIATFFSAWVSNRSNDNEGYRLSVQDAQSGAPLDLKGQQRIDSLEPGRNRQLQFAVLSEPTSRSRQVEFLLHNDEGEQLALSEAVILPQGMNRHDGK